MRSTNQTIIIINQYYKEMIKTEHSMSECLHHTQSPTRILPYLVEIENLGAKIKQITLSTGISIADRAFVDSAVNTMMDEAWEVFWRSKGYL